MKTLLIPTDFCLNTLNFIPGIIKQFYPEKLNIILVHLMKITGNAQDLHTLSRRSAEYQSITNEFHNSCNWLKHSNPKSIHKISIEFFYGSTIAVFKKFLEDNQVDHIVTLKGYAYKRLKKNSIEPHLLVARSNKDVIEADSDEHLPWNTNHVLKLKEEALLV